MKTVSGKFINEVKPVYLSTHYHTYFHLKAAW